MTNKIEIGYIYIVYSRASSNLQENIYKIGKSKDYITRIKGYCKGSEFKLVLKVNDFHNCEKKIKRACIEKYIQRRDYGSEYFECKLRDLYYTVVENCIIIEEVIKTDDIFKNKKCSYECPRCGYKAKQKSHIRKHFTELKKECPAIKNDILLHSNHSKMLHFSTQNFMV